MSIQEKAIQHKHNQLETRLKRETIVVEGRRDGKTYRQIALETGRDVKDVWVDYQNGMDRLIPIEHRETYRRLVLERLEYLFEDAMTGVKLAEDDREWRDNADVFLKVTDRIIKVMGLDKHEPESAFEIDMTVRFEDVKHGMDVLVAEGLVEVTGTEVVPTLPVAVPDEFEFTEMTERILKGS